MLIVCKLFRPSNITLQGYGIGAFKVAAPALWKISLKIRVSSFEKHFKHRFPM